MMRSNFIVGACLAMLIGSALAKPAPWYQWRSKVDGALACSQTALGPGWEKASGPYFNPQCQRR
jgi:hypothetical protein